MQELLLEKKASAVCWLTWQHGLSLVVQDRDALCVSHSTQTGAFSVEQCSPKLPWIWDLFAHSDIFQLDKLGLPSPPSSSHNATLKMALTYKGILAI